METHRPIERQAFSAREGCFPHFFFTGWLFSTREGCFPDRFLRQKQIVFRIVFFTGWLFSTREGCFAAISVQPCRPLSGCSLSCPRSEHVGRRLVVRPPRARARLSELPAQDFGNSTTTRRMLAPRWQEKFIIICLHAERGSSCFSV